MELELYIFLLVLATFLFQGYLAFLTHLERKGTQAESKEETDVIEGEIEDEFKTIYDGAIHYWFGLSRANYLTIPRSLLQEMPFEWQRRFVQCLNEMDECYSWPEEGTYQVQLKGADGKFVKDPLRNYRHPDRKLINKVKNKEG